MSQEKYPNIANFLGLLDGVLGCLWSVVMFVIVGPFLLWVLAVMFG